MEEKTKFESWFSPTIDRRKFIKVSAALTAATTLSDFLKHREAKAVTLGENLPDAVDGGVVTRFSVCQNCHARCGLLGKIEDGILIKLDGNPYHPNNMEEDERLPYSTPPSEAAMIRGRLCPKGQAGLQVLYDPYRVMHPLRRVGTRGSGKWEVISWNQAMSEIAQRIEELIPLDQRMSTPIYSPDSGLTIGPIANLLAFTPGRLTDGDFTERIFKGGFGTANSRLDHTSICETSHHVGNELITENRKNHFKPDIIGSEFIIFFGANPLEANFPMLALARKLMEFNNRGGKYVIVDPRFSNSAAQAWKWVPIKPGTDAALALGMARWIIESNRYDVNYLSRPNSSAASGVGEKTYTDATYLINLNTKKYLNSAEAGILSTNLDSDIDKTATTINTDTTGFATSGLIRVDDEIISYKSITPTSFTECTRGASGTSAASHKSGSTVSVPYVVKSGGFFQIYSQVSQADIEVDEFVNSTPCKSVFTLYWERVMEKNLSEYAGICGLDVRTITELASEFTSHGKKAVANTYRGAVQHTNGTYNQLAVMSLNALIGNYDWKGGNAVGGGSWSVLGEKPGQVNVKSIAGGLSPKGIRIDRSKTKYESTYLFTRDGGYPAQRPWFPLGSSGNFQEVIPSALDGYPYTLKVLITYWNAWPYSTPALRKVWEDTLGDETKIPLYVAIETHIGEASSWADYILPDVTYLERWSFPGMTPTILTKATPLRQPLVGGFDGKPWNAPFDPGAPNNYDPILPDTRMLEDILIDLANRLGLPGVGANAFGDGSPLNNAWDFIKKELQNLSIETGKGVDEIIAKGGVFEDPGNSYSGDYLKYTYGNIIHLYIETLVRTKDSISGQAYDPLPNYEPIKDAGDQPVEDSSYPFQLVTYKPVIHAQARTAALPWMMLIRPENFVEMNTSDARFLGVETGDLVKVTSPSNSQGIIGKAKVTEGVRPSVVAIAHSYGHWELGSKPREEDGIDQDFDPSRGAGIQPTVVMRLDPYVGNVTLQDKIGGSASFYDTRVNIEKVR